MIKFLSKIFNKNSNKPKLSAETMDKIEDEIRLKRQLISKEMHRLDNEIADKLEELEDSLRETPEYIKIRLEYHEAGAKLQKECPHVRIHPISSVCSACWKWVKESK